MRVSSQSSCTDLSVNPALKAVKTHTDLWVNSMHIPGSYVIECTLWQSKEEMNTLFSSGVVAGLLATLAAL